MTGSAISGLNKIVKVLFNKNGNLKSFITTYDGNSFTMYLKRPGNSYYYNKCFTIDEFEEIKELFKSPIEKIDLDQLEKF